MNAIEFMKNEHEYIKRMLSVVRNICMQFIDSDKLEYEDFQNVIDFIRSFADGHHHNKEEIILFNRMVDNIDTIGEKLITHGMLVEHDLGRLYVSNLEKALNQFKSGDYEAKLDIIANAVSYTNLLSSHIDKEDRVIFEFANRELDRDILDIVDKECDKYEDKNKKVREKYINLLENLELKYSK
ncbi:MAG: hemerythrin domain-containing protein [Intestinibacter sp.]|uniref:hemerythrin domain-containing protein n=1 Tax=Intestinibacter sp. TaxID=1965304 RepID=UPI003F164688